MGLRHFYFRCVNRLYRDYIKSTGRYNLKKLIDIQFNLSFGHSVHWEHPADLNEKIQWLKVYGDRELWARCADKYKVRQYVEERGLGHLLVKLYGRWEKAEDINWQDLPDSFVLKANNGSGDTLICTNKKEIDTGSIVKSFAEYIKSPYGITSAEPHYSIIRPCIIAEELLEPNKQSIPSRTLVDYKIWCFNGVPSYVWVCINRIGDSTEVGLYDIEWNYHPEYSIFCDHYKKAPENLPRPACLKQMLDAAAILSNGHPEVRVDLYEVDGKVYFGEMTFTSLSGYMNFYTQDFLYLAGEKVSLKQ